MARKPEYTYERVAAAITQLRKEGIKDTVRNIMDRMGGGDPSKVCEHVAKFREKEIEALRPEIKISEELHLKMKSEIVDNVVMASACDRQEIEGLKEHCAETQEIMVRGEQERVVLSEENESLRKEKADIERRYEAEVVSLTERLASSDKSLKEVQSESATIIKQLEGLKVATALATEEAGRLKSSTEQAARRIEELEKENKELSALNSKLDKDFTVATAQAAMLRESIAKLEKDKQDADARHEKVMQAQQLELKDSRSQCEAISAELAKTMAAKARAETKLTEVEKSHGVLEERLRNLSVTGPDKPTPPKPDKK